MGFRVEGRIDGLEPLLQKMAGLKATVRRKVLRSAMRKSASLVNKAAKQKAAVGETGQLKRSLGVKVKIYKSGVVIGVVEPRPGFRVLINGKRPHDPRKIAHLVERGTKARVTKTGAPRGEVSAKPFLGPAFQANAERIVAVFAEEIDKELAKL